MKVSAVACVFIYQKPLLFFFLFFPPKLLTFLLSFFPPIFFLYIVPAIIAYFEDYIPKWLIPYIWDIGADIQSYFPPVYAREMTVRFVYY